MATLSLKSSRLPGSPPRRPVAGVRAYLFGRRSAVRRGAPFPVVKAGAPEPYGRLDAQAVAGAGGAASGDFLRHFRSTPQGRSRIADGALVIAADERRGPAWLLAAELFTREKGRLLSLRGRCERPPTCGHPRRSHQCPASCGRTSKGIRFPTRAPVGGRLSDPGGKATAEPEFPTDKRPRADERLDRSLRRVSTLPDLATRRRGRTCICNGRRREQSGVEPCWPSRRRRPPAGRKVAPRPPSTTGPTGKSPRRGTAREYGAVHLPTRARQKADPRPCCRRNGDAGRGRTGPKYEDIAEPIPGPSTEVFRRSWQSKHDPLQSSSAYTEHDEQS